MPNHLRGLLPTTAAAIALLASGCGNATSGASGRLKVIATTTQLGDVVRNVGGNAVDVTQILKANTDPHEYEPRPADVTETTSAKLVVLSGDNLDRWMSDVVKQSATVATQLDVSKQLKITRPGQVSGAEASKYDPHWWHDPQNVETAVGQIRDALIKVDPASEATYVKNATAYLSKLRALDSDIAACFAKVPAGERKLVTDHDAFGYFADRYDILVVGAVIPSQTTQGAPSARGVARLARTIEAQHVRAVFPESSVNPRLAKAIAKQTGATATLTLYGDTLGPKGSPGDTYLGMERANADAMVRGFTGGKASCRSSA